MTKEERDQQTAARYVRIGWKKLEMEEQAHARDLARKRLLVFGKEGTITVIRLSSKPGL